MTTMQDAYQLLHDGAIALSQVESNGIRIDLDYLYHKIEDTGTKIKELQERLRKDDIYKVWRRKYREKANLGSREQLADIIFNKMGHKIAGYTEKGRIRADVAALQTVDLPFVQDYIKCEKYKKIKGTFLEGIRREVCDGFLHPSFNLNTVVTFRSSSSSPNFQNLPIRDPDYAEIIRKCFIARKGRVLVEIDYSGIEVRISACYNNDPNLIKYINDPSTDMHRDTAMDLFFLKQNQVEKRTTRDWAKNRFVFPQFYGSVYFQCAPHLWEAASQDQFKLPGTDKSIREHLREQGIKKLGDCIPGEVPRNGTFEAHVKSVEDSFWNKRFRVYSEWKKKWYSDYRKNAGFTMLTGFPVKGLFSRNDVINYPVQGSAFHCLLQSLVWIQQAITKRKMKSRIVGQIHDSIIADVPVDELQDYLNLARKTMTRRLTKEWQWIIVPLEIEADVTPVDGSWWDKTAWEEVNGTWQAKA